MNRIMTGSRREGVRPMRIRFDGKTVVVRRDGLLAPRFAPSQRAWALTGVSVPVSPTVNASAGRDADDR